MLSENYLVKKTTPLIYAQWANLGINELKIVEVYLSRIDVQNKNTCVRFTKKEFADLMGYKDSRNLKTRVFDDRLSHFLSQQIKIDLEDGSGYHRFNLFSDAKCYYDPTELMAVVDIDCNPKLTPVFVALADGKNGGFQYISYRVEKVKKMESEYSIKLYNLLLLHAWGNYKWIVNLKDLRTLLGAVEKSHETFKFFNYHVLKKAQKEINELTDIEFEYEKILKGRVTTGILFKIKKRKEKAIEMNTPMNGEQSFDAKSVPEKELEPYQIFYQQVNLEAFDNTFSEEEAAYLVHLGKKVADSKVTQSSTDADENNAVRIEYYREKYLQMMAGNPKSKKGLLEHFLKIDAAALAGYEYAGKDESGKGKWKSKVSTPLSRFNNFENRTYDWDEFEKQILSVI